ncbi:hypothetical protein E4U40_005029 [Claviceps sp. LM458 group G5]|nr:hypothetical protein E4U40_005029 [Claviceps sp. LM458 group G5]KAG6049961.1 hypothetical protein E4U39_005170 [Claviceps sp. Clav50 group G5]
MPSMLGPIAEILSSYRELDQVRPSEEHRTPNVSAGGITTPDLAGSSIAELVTAAMCTA